MKESKRVSTLSYSGQHGDNGIVLKCRHVVLVTGSSRGEVELKGGEVKEETVKLLCAGLGWARLGWAGLGAAGTFFNKLQQAGRQPPLSPLSSTSSILHPDWLHTSPPQVAELRLVGTKCPGALLAGVARLRSVNFELGPVKPVLATKLPAAAAR